jgi:acetate kinase
MCAEAWNILGIKVDHGRNDANADTISADDSQCIIRVIPANEDMIIARHIYRLLFSQSDKTDG